MLNDQEARHISGRSSLEEAVVWLRGQRIPIVTVKRGADGAGAYYGQEVAECTVTPVTGGDSIGAGDSFDAGFLAGWLRGLPLSRCLEIAYTCGRSFAGEVGGLEGQPTWETVAGAVGIK